MTRVLYISPYYLPEQLAPAVCVSEVAKRLVKRGYEVTVLTTFPNYPTGIVPPEYRGRMIQHEILDGVDVVRVWSYIVPNKGFLRRILSQFSFAFLSPLLGWKASGRPDVIIVESPPLFDAIAGRLLTWGKRCPYIFTVSDIWPESAIQLGALRNKLLIRLAEWLEWTTYQKAGLVWAVTEEIHNTLVKRGLAPEQVFTLTNGVDITQFRPSSREQARAELGWDDRYTVLYVGNHGMSQGLTTVLEAAQLMENIADVRFVLAGDGAEKADLLVWAQQHQLKNVTFLASQPHEQVPTLLTAADVCLVPLRRLPVFKGVLPTKMFEMMACARPILLGVEGEARRVGEQEAGAAIYVEPENPTALVSAILNLREYPELAEELGRRGRAFVEARFDRDKLTTDLEGHISVLTGKKVPRSQSALYRCWRRGMDLASGLCGLLVLTLILPVLALLIYLDSPGPIFFLQERLGYQGKKFLMYKFRSMHISDPAAQQVWTTKDDPRVTRVGRFMRATHLDELPQVLNILRGEMSLIGPRPEQELYAVELEKADPSYRRRLAAKPGLTGWAQVQYGYGNSSQDELVKLKYDLYYIQHQSFLFDLRIILLTIVEVLLRHGT